MKRSLPISYPGVVICMMVATLISSPALASVKYKFVVSEQPAGDFFKPMIAEMVLSDAAVAAGKARKGQIESIVISGGPAMQEPNRITLTYLHNQFTDLTVKLSADRTTVTAITATLTPSGAPIDHWVFYYPRPEHPTLQIHEFLAYVRPDSVTLETTILPVPPTTYFDRFNGEWRRVSRWRFCWLDWMAIAVGVIVVTGLAWRLRRGK